MKVTLLGVGALAITLMGTGCATKKFVRKQVEPVDARVTEVDKKQTEAVNALDQKMTQNLSRVEERAMTAENKATQAGQAAQKAQQTADSATQAAQTANSAAQQNQTKISELTTAYQNIDNYKVAAEDSIAFGFNKATLTKDAKAKLDQLVQSTGTTGRYVIEVQGFTDRSGPADYNLALSRRRADAVARYLIDKQVPLRRIHMIGLGEMTPSMGQLTRQGTPQNISTDQPAQQSSGKMRAKDMRVVVVRVWVPETTLAASSTPPSQSENQPSTPAQPTQPPSSESNPSPTPR